MASTDVFICHASEDKDEFVRPLARALEQRGVTVWYDEGALGPGSSLRQSIDAGLLSCDYAVVVLSSAFVKKKWTAWELNGIVQRQVFESRSIILPVWHDIDYDEVKSYSPSLADLVALNSRDGVATVATQIVSRLGLDQPYRQITGAQRVKILSDCGNQAEWWVQRELEIGAQPLTRFEFPIDNSYETVPFFSNEGTIAFPVYTGGRRVLRLSYDPPVPPRSKFQVTVGMMLQGAFTEEDNIVHVCPRLPYGMYSIQVTFPKSAPPGRIWAYRQVGQLEAPLEGLEVLPDRSEARLVIAEPVVNARQCLAWSRGSLR